MPAVSSYQLPVNPALLCRLATGYRQLATINWQDRRESNPQPPVLETGALPIELLSFFIRGTSSRRNPLTPSLAGTPCPAPLRWHARFARAEPSSELLRFAMTCVLAAEATVLAQFEPLARLLFILRRAVVAPLTFRARERDDVSHCAYSTISLIVPAPTVRPPSRIAKRAPFSSATGTCSSAVIDVLSPGITISTPSGSLSEPVTSVVRM